MLTLVSLITSSIYAQEKATTVTTFSNPVELKLKVNRRDYNRKNNFGGNFAIENFYPVGWSKDGKFAYYTEPVDEACDCYFGNLVIVDLKNDAIIWHFDYTSDEPEEGKKKPRSLGALWNANRQLFSTKLSENNIKPYRAVCVLPFPISYKTDRLTLALSFERKPMSEEDRIYGDISRVRVEVTSKQNGKKSVFDHNYPEAKPLYIGMIGYLKSPLEPRVAIILVEIYRGYEGPPHVGGVRIVGMSLGKHFKNHKESYSGARIFSEPAHL
jgi:hypothetical protein